MLAAVRYGSGAKMFRRLPCVEGSGKVLARAENTELL